MDGSGDNFRQLIQTFGSYIWILMLAFWGGTASYISRIRRNKLPFSIIELIGEWCISGFAGVVMMYICLDLSMSTPITAVATGIAGHMGGRAIYLIEIWFTKRFEFFQGPKQ